MATAPWARGDIALGAHTTRLGHAATSPWARTRQGLGMRRQCFGRAHDKARGRTRQGRVRDRVIWGITLIVTCQDIAYSVSVLSQYMSSPIVSHWVAVEHILCYLKEAPVEYCIRSTNIPELSAFQTQIGLEGR